MLPLRFCHSNTSNTMEAQMDTPTSGSELVTTSGLVTGTVPLPVSNDGVQYRVRTWARKQEFVNGRGKGV